ncbi:MAG: ribosome small subunit-dependent GTPase A [Proteobacteria bacterium]|nr:ribosome small subunit-dependent GTPase A [Pseudomonadota bacterium]
MTKNWLRKDWAQALKSQSLSRLPASQERLKTKGYSATSLLAESFEISPELFDSSLRNSSSSSDYLYCIVFELHKHKALLAPMEPCGDIQRQKAFLASISRKFLYAPRSEKSLITVGDYVVVIKRDHHSCQIIHRRRRWNALVRQDPFCEKRRHVLGSNIDQIIVVSSITAPEISWHLINQYLTLAMIQDMAVVCVFTKMDLWDKVNHHQQKIIDDRIHYLSQLSIPTFRLSIHDRENLSSLSHSLFQGKVSIVSGLSGVGKSTLINYSGGITPCKVASADQTAYGRHTTSASRLVELHKGGMIMDTPGIKTMLLDPLLLSKVAMGFPEFQALLGCKFQPCYHLHEPDCAIKKALKEDIIPQWRYASYSIMQTKSQTVQKHERYNKHE